MRLIASGNEQKTGFFRILLVGLGMLFVWSLTLSLFDLLGLGGRVEDIESDVGGLRIENERLVEEAEKLQTQEAQEKLIREKLGLVQPGETVVIIPEEMRDQNLDINEQESVEEELQVWEQWKRLFF